MTFFLLWEISYKIELFGWLGRGFLGHDYRIIYEINFFIFWNYDNFLENKKKMIGKIFFKLLAGGIKDDFFLLYKILYSD